MVWFRECWHEEVLRQLRQGLTKCYQVAFDHRGDGETIFLKLPFFILLNSILVCSLSLLYQIEPQQTLSESLTFSVREKQVMMLKYISQ